MCIEFLLSEKRDDAHLRTRRQPAFSRPLRSARGRPFRPAPRYAICAGRFRLVAAGFFPGSSLRIVAGWGGGAMYPVGPREFSSPGSTGEAARPETGQGNAGIGFPDAFAFQLPPE